MIKLTSISEDVLYVQPDRVEYIRFDEKEGATEIGLSGGTGFWVIETPQEIAESIVSYLGFRQDYASVSRRLMEMNFDQEGIVSYKRSVMDSLTPLGG